MRYFVKKYRERILALKKIHAHNRCRKTFTFALGSEETSRKTRPVHERGQIFVPRPNHVAPLPCTFKWSAPKCLSQSFEHATWPYTKTMNYYVLIHFVQPNVNYFALSTPCKSRNKNTTGCRMDALAE